MAFANNRPKSYRETVVNHCGNCGLTRLFELPGADILTCVADDAPEFDKTPIDMMDIEARRVDSSHVCDLHRLSKG